LDSTNAFEALVTAAGSVDLDASDAELIRIGSNAVFRFATEPIIGRVGPSVAKLDSASREVAVAGWLESAGIPAVRALKIEQPLAVNDRVVTLWWSASEKVEYGDTQELARLLLQLHSLEPQLQLPAHDPLSKAVERISAIDSLEAKEREFLQDRFEELASAYRGLEFDLPPGVIHGDANIGNVIRDREGAALLADLDGFAIGPREWDLILTALYYERFGWHAESEYALFTETYGYDVMKWSGYATMRDLRELLMVAWIAQSVRTDAGRRELAKRIETLRTDGSREDWRPF
jgi:aminoglycoside phosphotransferase (APT) family kinase protein